MKRTWTDYHLFQLYMLYPYNALTDTAYAIGKNPTSVKSKATVLGIKKEVKFFGGTTTSTPAIDKFLLQNYLTYPVKQIAAMIGKSHTFVKTRLRQLNLIIPREIIEKRKADSRYAKGSVSFNKGLKQTDFMSQEQITRSAKTRFKKGQTPHNTKADGCLTIRTDKSGRAYQYYRIAQGVWQFLHVKVWIDNNGPVPDRMVIVFKDGNTMNCTINNLEMISREELMQRNTIHRFPTELKEIIRLSNKLERTLKTKHDEKQTA